MPYSYFDEKNVTLTSFSLEKFYSLEKFHYICLGNSMYVGDAPQKNQSVNNGQMHLNHSKGICHSAARKTTSSV